ncbi:hypothetical protein CGCF415_v013512 [Colletotrichum fructicola]|uniref:Uncharacterized protein n=5 Tax=Colletotrichum gloeosporioides species complex TaxID=2707338 RepID=T0LAU1_COLGC|nr:uncharacterized protein CGMCC3_g3191 [Colletotrichum fructicola]XP_036502166.1 uncharacterized protein CGCS363_v001097 [Colletotrichum siamense]XP_037184998.1 uncharacterized protein CGCA056_v001091 [Colletotrichum aenigma]XP_045264070.1 uncharacterized protein GCG54_00004181 [Colletotrichum gloeosporioides]EQB48886.1 hypothetical protein CGLO_11835 [Colletotrichum gloeosporioides Cg-14]KAF0319842.1 hypothetical protein GQ607_012944 [Colletotrichum asianum]KAF4491388.1 hypothetical protein
MLASHGRGGAGNMADSTKSPKVTPKDLETPTLKTSVVTTGRGGSGNMAKNADPYETRLRQDVEGVPRRESNGATHYGRGGAANVFKTGSEEEAAAKKAKAEATAAVEDDESSLRKTPSPTGGRRSPEDGNGLAAKGKQWLNNLTKKA